MLQRYVMLVMKATSGQTCLWAEACETILLVLLFVAEQDYMRVLYQTVDKDRTGLPLIGTSMLASQQILCFFFYFLEVPAVILQSQSKALILCLLLQSGHANHPIDRDHRNSESHDVPPRDDVTLAAALFPHTAAGVLSCREVAASKWRDDGLLPRSPSHVTPEQQLASKVSFCVC